MEPKHHRAIATCVATLVLAAAAALPIAAAGPKKKDPEAEKLRPAPEAPGKSIERPGGALEPGPPKVTPGRVDREPTPQPVRPQVVRPRKATRLGTVPRPPGGQIQVYAPTADQAVPLGTHVEIRWGRFLAVEGESSCGDRVDLYAVRLETNESFPIAEHRENDVGSHRYRWLVMTPTFHDIRGDYRVDLVSASAPADPACRAQSAPFRIVSAHEMSSATVGSDFGLGSVSFMHGRPLDAGIAFDPDGIETTLHVGVFWNGESHSPATEPCTVRVFSDVTGDRLSQRSTPSGFSHDDAHLVRDMGPDGEEEGMHGIIEVAVAIAIDAEQLMAMRRDRFIPLRVQLFTPEGVDAHAHNNTKVVNMRILDAPVPSDLELTGFSGFTMELEDRDRDQRRTRFTLGVQARNLSRDEAGGATLPDVSGARATWEVGSPTPDESFRGGGSTKADGFALSPIPGSAGGSTTTFEGVLLHPPNWWGAWIEVTIHPPEGVIDPDLSNNTARYELPVLE